MTPDKFKADLASGNLGSIFADSVPTGGPAVLRAHDSQPAWDPLQGGTYAVVCFVTGADGIPHFAKGMVAFFTVNGSVTPAKLAALHPHKQRGVITAHDLFADAKAYFQRLTRPGGPGPAPFWNEGGHGAVVPHGGHGWFRVDDDPGHYVAYCLVPDDMTGIPHAALGMAVGFRVE